MSSPANREREVFNSALDRPTAAERIAYLDGACGEDLELRARVEQLLHSHDQAGGFLPEDDPKLPAGAPATTFVNTSSTVPVTEKTGDRIGHYKLLQKIGEGGCGVVYMAEQEEPVRRRVALKVIKLGMDTKSVIARFEAERQALALMDHPNIAKVLDAGATDTGRPYFVMELVRGVKMTEFCDEQNLSTAERLKLFIQVCQAIQHAHQKGIIHRDIKPSNILVADHDGVPVPKVIDFGIAKATTDQRLTDKTLFTALEQFIGTPAYMSPEQANLSGLDIDTRTDIYSLGVLLYELLTGETPFNPKELLAAGLDEMRRTIREVEPLKPSTRLTQEVGRVALRAPEGVSHAGGSDRGNAGFRTEDGARGATRPTSRNPEQLKDLIHLLRGDLDWIVMKALEKDRTRRYETASGLAMDIQRHLHNEPIMARPQSAAYRFQKMIRRNKVAFAAAGAITLVLVLGVITSSWQAMRMDKERRIAEANKRVAVAAAEAEKHAKLSAEAREAETKAVLEFVQNKVFFATWPGGLGRDVTLRAALEAALSSVDRSFPEQPLIEARLRLTLATTFGKLGDYRISADQEERARRIYSKSLGADHPDTLKSMHNLAISYDALGRQAEAFKLREETLALMKAKLGPDHPETLSAMNNLALSYASLGQKREALKLHEETLALKKAKFGPDHPATLGSMNNLALASSANGRHAEAIQLSEEVLALQKAKFGPDDPATLGCMDSLASIYNAAGRRSEAVELYEQTLARMRDKLGSDHPTTLTTMHSLAGGYAALGRQREAGSLYDETFALRKARLGPDHPETLRTMNKLARLLATSTDPKVRNTSRALELAEKAVELAPKEGNYWNTLGVAHYNSGECKAAVAALGKSMELRKGGNSFDWFFLSMAECQLGNKEEARKQYERAVAWMNKNDPKNESLTLFRRQAADLLGVIEK